LRQQPLALLRELCFHQYRLHSIDWDFFGEMHPGFAPGVCRPLRDQVRRPKPEDAHHENIQRQVGTVVVALPDEIFVSDVRRGEKRSLILWRAQHVGNLA
jgi:hypothetical protein